jgi:hypothetical protein
MNEDNTSQWAFRRDDPNNDNEILALTSHDGGSTDPDEDHYETGNTLDNGLAERYSIPPPAQWGFYFTLNKLRHSATKPDALEKELLWQQAGANGNTAAQNNFKDELLAQRHLRTVAFMCKHSSYITIGHSIAKFFGEPGDEEKGLHAKCIAFIGDRKDTREPQSVILPHSAWEWVNPEVFEDYEALGEFFDPQNGNQTRLFTPPIHTTELTELTTKKHGTRQASKKKGESKKGEHEGGEDESQSHQGDKTRGQYKHSKKSTFHECFISQHTSSVNSTTKNIGHLPN